MTDPSNANLPQDPNPARWTDSQLQHVTAELGKEYPTRSRHAIRAAVSAAQSSLDPAQGTVRLLAHARKQIARQQDSRYEDSRRPEDGREGGGGWRLPA
jgi:hypothetical protein